jgi:hypothetical protein
VAKRKQLLSLITASPSPSYRIAAGRPSSFSFPTHRRSPQRASQKFLAIVAAQPNSSWPRLRIILAYHLSPLASPLIASHSHACLSNRGELPSPPSTTSTWPGHSSAAPALSLAVALPCGSGMLTHLLVLTRTHRSHWYAGSPCRSRRHSPSPWSCLLWYPWCSSRGLGRHEMERGAR